MPRYVRNLCCGDSGHVTNQGEKGEFLGAEKRLLDAAVAGDRTREAKVIDLCKLFGSAENPLQELTTPDGTSVWAVDGVHLTSPAYKVVARLLAAELERSVLGETGEPATKRPRLENVVPAPALPPAKLAFKAPPPMPKPVARRCGCPVNSPQTRNTATTGTPGMARTMVAAEEVGAREGAVAEAAAGAVARARTSLCLEKEKSESASESSNYNNTCFVQ
jgi:hypothetical protein